MKEESRTLVRSRICCGNRLRRKNKGSELGRRSDCSLLRWNVEGLNRSSSWKKRHVKGESTNRKCSSDTNIRKDCTSRQHYRSRSSID